MINVNEVTYSHKQKAPFGWMLCGLGLIPLIAAWQLYDESPVALILIGSAVLMFLLGLAFQHLVVRDAGDRLDVHFGPLPLFRTSITYSDIQKVEMGRTMLLESWGIHMSPRGGWVWNIWGRDCVVIYCHNKVIRIGTDDAPNLLHFLQEKIGQS